MPRWLPNLLPLVITLAVPIVLILSNVLLFMNPSWLAFQYSQPDFPKAERFNDKDRLYYGSESIEYIRGNRTLEQFKALGVYQDREISHMVDVRVLVDAVKVFLPIVAILAVIALVALTRRTETVSLAPRGLFNGAATTIVLFIAVGIFAATGFDTFFTLFHRIFFTGDTWLFLYTDSLIQFYPLPFWFATSILLVGLTIGEAIVIGAIGWWWERRVASRL
jgi:integral membrane protein (TIGR01906 family)